MTAPGSTSGYGVWNADDYPLTVEYPMPLIEEIRSQALAGLNSPGHGGREVGGVLYGTRDGNMIRVASAAQLSCEHARGPGFVLSEKDQEAFATLRRKAPRGFESVGFYCSHTHGGLALSPNDEVLFESYFPQTGRIALVVKPTHWGSVEAIFCYRSGNGELCTPPPRCRFQIEPVNAGTVQAGAPAEQSAAEPIPSEPVLSEPAPCEAVEPEKAVEPEEALPPDEPGDVAAGPARRRARWPWLAAAALAAALGVVYLLQAPSERLDLRAYAVAPAGVQIEWNRRSPAVLAARSGVLEITDGTSHVRLPLTAEQLRSASITYARQSASLVVRLRLDESTPGAGALEESVAFKGPPVPPAAVAAGKPAPFPAAGRETPQPAPVAVSVDGAAAKPEQTSEVIPEETAGLAADAEREAPPARPSPVEPTRRFVPPPRRASLRPAPAVLLTPPPLASPSAGSSPLLAQVALPPPIRAPEPPAYSGPRSGRLIWTGSLGRRGVVEINGARASVGSLIGALPRGVPLSFRVSPAEFKGHGLVVYTTDAALNNRREAAGGSNGWNTTTYEWDPERAHRIAVLEAPNSTNDFNRLVLRSDARSCSVVVIDWTVRQSQ